jgi:FkbH-like protein
LLLFFQKKKRFLLAMDTGSPLQDIFRQKLINSYWVFGPHWGEPKTNQLVFGEDGTIQNYQHPNERRWQISAGRLEIFDAAGALMWAAAGRYVENQAFCISLVTPRDPNARFVLKEFGPRAAPPVPASIAPAAPPARAAALTAADFLFPKDLAVTPTKLQRVRLVGSCMTALYHEQFQLIAPDTKFDYLVFNYAGELPPPTETYDLQYVQLPLRSVLTDRVVWATRIHDEGFVEDVLQTGYSVIDAMLAGALSPTRGLLTFVSNFIVPQMSVTTSLSARYTKFDLAQVVRRLNDHLAATLQNYPNVWLADVNGIAESMGKQYVLDDMINFYAHNGAFFSEWVGYERPARIEQIPPMDDFYPSKRLEFARAVWQQIIAQLRAIRQTDQVKAVVFDLDHTLWRGQLAEDYRQGDETWPHADGWPIGLWETVHHLRARGILTAICSKNDEAVVRRDWHHAVEPAFVSLDDFVCVKINWRTKAENIAEICNELSIKPKSVVFVDDNPVERAAVKAALPDIRVIGANPYLTRRILLWSPETQVASLTDESTRREEMIRSQFVREEERKTLTRDEFLASLNCRVTFIPIGSADQPEFSRAVELLNKTNQFNTTGKRWPQAELLEFIAQGGALLAFRVADRFTDYGLVGVLLTRGNEITQFVMSCRVLGMDVELFALAHVITLIRAAGSTQINATLIHTQDNSPCRDVYTRAGFVEARPEKFVLTADGMPVTPGHVGEA